MIHLNPQQKNLRKKLLSFYLSRIYFLAYIPSLFFWRVRIIKLDARECVVRIPFSWMSKNPFRSIYFAAQAGAAELSTGAAALLASHTKNISMLVVGMKVEYFKKASSVSTFHCEDVALAIRKVEEAQNSGKAATCVLKSTGRNKNGEIISEFHFTWSFKKRSEGNN